MKEIFFAFLTGCICGGTFTILNLPIPAPPVFAGIAGIIGVWCGFCLVNYIRRV